MCIPESSSDANDGLGHDLPWDARLAMALWLDLRFDVLDGLGQACMYIFFHPPFAISILNKHFDLQAPFNGVLYFMVHLVFTPPQLSRLFAMEIDPSELSSSSTLASSFGGGQVITSRRNGASNYHCWLNYFVSLERYT